MDGDVTGEILATVREGDVDLAWDDGKGVVTVDFETAPALAVLLAREVVFPNAQHWRKDLPESDRGTLALIVDCSDVFAWGCADGEVLPYRELERLYRMWRRDPTWGPAAWAIMRRGTAPQTPVRARIDAAGIWDVDALLSPGAAAYVDGLALAVTA